MKESFVRSSSFAAPQISKGKGISSLFRIFAAPSTHQDVDRARLQSLFCVSSKPSGRCEHRHDQRVILQCSFRNPFRQRRTRKSSVPFRVQERNVTNSWFSPASIGSRPGQQRDRSPIAGGVGIQSISWFFQLRVWLPTPPTLVIQDGPRVPEHLLLLKGNVVFQDVIRGPS